MLLNWRWGPEPVQKNSVPPFWHVMITTSMPFVGAVTMARVMSRSSAGFHAWNAGTLFVALVVLAAWTVRVYGVYKRLAPRVSGSMADPTLKETLSMLIRTLMIANYLFFFVEMAVAVRS